MNAGPLELPVLLGAFERGGDEELGAVLAESLEDAAKYRESSDGHARSGVFKVP